MEPAIITNPTKSAAQRAKGHDSSFFPRRRITCVSASLNFIGAILEFAEFGSMNKEHLANRAHLGSTTIWSAPAKRSGDGALGSSYQVRPMP